MTLSYNLNIPDSANNPSVDQPKMQTNTNSISTIWGQDHYTFAETNFGQHRYVRLPTRVNPGVPVGVSADIYTEAPTTGAASQLNYQNSAGIFPLNALRAWGFVDGTAGGVAMGVNINTSVKASSGVYNITLTANAVSSNVFAVIVASQLTSGPLVGTQSGYEITGTGQFTLRFTTLNGNALVDPVNFTFIVLQI